MQKEALTPFTRTCDPEDLIALLSTSLEPADREPFQPRDGGRALWPSARDARARHNLPRYRRGVAGFSNRPMPGRRAGAMRPIAAGADLRADGQSLRKVQPED